MSRHRAPGNRRASRDTHGGPGRHRTRLDRTPALVLLRHLGVERLACAIETLWQARTVLTLPA